MSKDGDILKLLGKHSTVSKIIKTKKSTTITKKIDTDNLNCLIKFDGWTIIGTHHFYKIPKNIPLDKSIYKLKIASFDLDGTIIKTKSGSRFSRNFKDWKWFNSNTLDILKNYQKNNYLIIIFTNQGGIIAKKEQKSFINFITKLNDILSYLENVFIYVSPKRPNYDKKKINHLISKQQDHDLYRKPNTGMWDELIKYLKENYKIENNNNINGNFEIDLENSFYCGDAAGRPQDFSDSDKVFAKNIGLPFYLPEEIFS
ncbi:hypothetical protein PACTADRAFT_31537 [Pachysolen tannophilus NRRL Y-2460]|uniref:DNA 3'-phosphatase n=1 Tax=Pachysolen tannophilus NRRL Y-2460 TaxID=669874 RepID=A0A1E4U2A4_PACTA|nr:hypothetical protein PACTADRAFT_31537 [Pachysolen tannophilus NRRL Y-2460]